MDLDYLINNNESEELYNIIKKYFNNDYEFFFQHLKDENLIPEDSISNTLFDLFPNEYINHLIENKKGNFVKEYFSENVSDIVKQGDKYYLEVSHLSDLHKLFPIGIQDFVENILGDDYDYYDVYDSYETRELINDLTKENFDRLVELIKEKFLNKSIYYNGDDDTILSFVKSDGSEDNFILTSNRLSQIIKIGLHKLIDNSEDLDSLKSDISNLYNSAYNSAMYDEYYNRVIDAIKPIFNISKNQPLGEFKVINTNNQKGEPIKKNVYLIDITNELLDYIKESIRPELGYWNNREEITGTQGSLLYYLNEYYRSQRVNLDYVSPSFSTVLDNYNSNFYLDI
jgi:hypothetical protein